MLRQVQLVVGSVMSSLVVIAIALSTAFTDDRFAAPPLWLLAVQVVAAVGIHLLVETIGYRTPALPPGTDAAEAGTTSSQALVRGTILRVAMCESIALASVAAAFVVEEGGYAGLLTGVVIALVLMAVHAWPRTAVVDRTAQSLERDGARSHLHERLGLAPQGPIQEL